MRAFFKRISEAPRVTATRIICGDCAGHETLPRMTFLTSAGCCANCGGRNYEHASRLTLMIARAIEMEPTMPEIDVSVNDHGAREYAN